MSEELVEFNVQITLLTDMPVVVGAMPDGWDMEISQDSSFVVCITQAGSLEVIS